MTPNVELAIRVLVFLVMATVGLDLRFRDFLGIREYPRLVPSVVIGHWIALVLTAGLVGRLLDLPDEVTGGALLIAAAPAAALSCFYAQLAGGHLALATTLAAVSNVLATLATPLVAKIGFSLFLKSAGRFELAAGSVAQQTLMGIMLPLFTGMLIRYRLGHRLDRWRAYVRAVGLVGILCVFAVVVVAELDAIRAQFASLLAAALAFTLTTFTIGVTIARIVSESASSRRALPWAFPARNVAVAVLIATSIPGKTAMVSLIAVLFATQLVLLVPMAIWMGSRARV